MTKLRMPDRRNPRKKITIRSQGLILFHRSCEFRDKLGKIEGFTIQLHPPNLIIVSRSQLEMPAREKQLLTQREISARATTHVHIQSGVGLSEPQCPVIAVRPRVLQIFLNVEIKLVLLPGSGKQMSLRQPERLLIDIALQ